MPGMGVAHGLNIGALLVWKLLSEVEAGFSQYTEPSIGYWGQEVDEPQVDSHPEAAPSCSGLGGRQMPEPLRSGIFTHELGRPPMLASEVGRAGCSETGQRGSTERIHAALHPRRAGGPCRLWAQAGFVLKRGCLHPHPHSSLGKKVHGLGQGWGLRGRTAR